MKEPMSFLFQRSSAGDLSSHNNKGVQVYATTAPNRDMDSMPCIGVSGRPVIQLDINKKNHSARMIIISI